MTEVEIKELARKYINSCTKRAGFVILTEGIMNDFIDLFVAGFMKCLELIEIKWHKVADGDLPKDDIKLAIIEIDDCGYLLCNYRNGFWYDANSGATCAEWITNNIIAWKEIVPPSLDKEKK